MSTTAAASRLGGGAAPDISIIRILVALLLCCLAALGIAAVLRVRAGRPVRFSLADWRKLRRGGAATHRLEVLESRRMSVHADICLVRCDDQDYLIACGPGGATVVNQPALDAVTREKPDDIA